jgi:hypothetical protein
LWRAQTGTPLRTPRKWAQVTKTEKLVSLVRPHHQIPRGPLKLHFSILGGIHGGMLGDAVLKIAVLGIGEPKLGLPSAPHVNGRRSRKQRSLSAL